MGPSAGELVGVDEVVVQPPAALAQRIGDGDYFFARRIDPITGNDHKVPAPAVPGDSCGDREAITNLIADLLEGG